MLSTFTRRIHSLTLQFSVSGFASLCLQSSASWLHLLRCSTRISSPFSSAAVSSMRATFSRLEQLLNFSSLHKSLFSFFSLEYPVGMMWQSWNVNTQLTWKSGVLWLVQISLCIFRGVWHFSRLFVPKRANFLFMKRTWMKFRILKRMVHCRLHHGHLFYLLSSSIDSVQCSVVATTTSLSLHKYYLLDENCK